MGWKNVKEHYKIGHFVQIADKGLCIGSPYVHDLIVVNAADLSITANSITRREGDLGRYLSEMEADKETLRQLIDTPDTFSASLTVYTYEGGKILEKQCEEYGWPNVTHDGLMMFENLFSPDIDKVVAWAKRNAEAEIELSTDALIDLKEKLAERERWLQERIDDLAELNAAYPA